jgi:hypothetical protein
VTVAAVGKKGDGHDASHITSKAGRSSRIRTERCAAPGAEDADVVIACLDFRGLLMDGWSLKHTQPVDWHEVIETVRRVACQEPECGTFEIAPGWEEP